jgi:putative ABC transport system permease protein
VIRLLVLILIVPVVVDVIRRPTFRNLALRNISRRRGEAVLVIVGSLLGTAIITASFVVGDTVEASIRDGARTSLGPIDESVQLTQASQRDQAQHAIADPPIADVDGLLPIEAAGAVVASTGADRKAQPAAAMLEVDFDQARQFGGDPATTGLADAGATPTGDEVVIGQKLASTLGVGPGQPIEVFAYGGSKVLTVRQTVPEIGLAGYVPVRTSRFIATQPSAIFVPKGTIDVLAAGSATANAQTPSYEVLVSNTGGVFTGADHTDAVFAELNARTSSVDGVQVAKRKADLLDQAKTRGDSLSQLFRTVGFFSVIAGILLLVNLFVMLSEERKSELGMLRAVGFKRNHLVRTFAIEGAVYSLVASVLGALVGVLVGWGIVAATSSLFNTTSNALTFSLTVKASSLVAGASLGLVISMLTVWGTSFRIARLNIIRAIRDLSDPILHRHSVRTLAIGSVVVLFGLLLFVAGWRKDTAALVLAGPAISFFGLIPVLGRFLPRKPVTVVLSALALAWGIGVFTIAPAKVSRAGIDVFVVQGMVLVAAGVAIFAQADRLWAALARGVSAAGGGGIAARLGLAYPLARKFRTSLLLAMYSIVIFTMAFITVLSGAFADQAPQFSNDMRSGFDVFVDSSQSNPVTTAQLQSVPGVATVSSLTRGLAQVTTVKHPDPINAAVTGFDDSLLAQGEPKLDTRDPGYASDTDAYQAVLTDPGLIIVNTNYGGVNQGGGGPPQAILAPGDKVTLTNAATKQGDELTVVGVMGSDLIGNAGLVSKPFLKDLLGPLEVDNRHYVKVAPGADPDQVAASISGAFIQNGASAHGFLAIVNDQLAVQIGFFGLLRAYLGLGLLIGIAGLGVVMVRAVRERRREIGMLRAMGFPAAVVRRAFVLEAAFIALQGIVLGIALGTVTGYNLLVNSDAFGDQQITFTWPWVALAVIGVVPLVASLLATAWPATQAARIRPAVALRIAD